MRINLIKIFPVGALTLLGSLLLVTGCDQSVKNKDELRAREILSTAITNESEKAVDLFINQKTGFACGTIKNQTTNIDRRFVLYLGPREIFLSKEEKIPDFPSHLPRNAFEALYMAGNLKSGLRELSKSHSHNEALDRLSSHVCYNNSPENNRTGSHPLHDPIISSDIECLRQEKKCNSFFDYEESLTSIPPRFIGNDLTDLALQIKINTKPKDPIEKTEDYDKRMSILKLDIGETQASKLFSFRIDEFDSTVSYDADKEIVNFKSDGFCIDKKLFRLKKNKPIICKPNSLAKLSISTAALERTRIFKKEVIGDAAFYGISDSFKLPSAKVPISGAKTIEIGAILVGKLIAEQINPKFEWVENPYLSSDRVSRHAISDEEAVPFVITEIVYFNSRSGEIIFKRNFQN